MENTFINKFEAVLFDLDGTLWNSTTTVLNAWQKALSTFDIIKGTISQSDLEGVFGMQHSLIGAKLFPYLDLTDQEMVMKRCFEFENETIARCGGNLYDGIIEVIHELHKKYPLYIVSNCQSGYIEAFLNYYNLNGLFRDYECSGNTSLPKHKNIGSIITRNNIKNCIYIGDTTGDYEAAKANGIPFIFAEYGFGKVDNPEYTIKTCRDLLNIL